MAVFQPGTMIGQYEVVSKPMMGGMGVVYFAIDHENDNHPVALKTFRPELLPDRESRDRFLREGNTWVNLGSHPHIVRCYKVEYIDPTAFLVLELIAKEQNMPDASLRSWLIPGRPLPLEQALLFALQIARGMQYATEKIPGFVHRDLKPENILVGADKLPGTNVNRLRITDFGLVKTIASDTPFTTEGNEEATKPNQVQFTRGAGTPLYMAPEQWKSEPVGVFTDVYAFGCILYEMLSGQHATEGKTIGELKASHCNGKLRTMPTNQSKDMSSFIMKCVDKYPTNRYRTWDEVNSNLGHVYAAGSKQSAPLLPPVIVIQEKFIQSGLSYHAIGQSYFHIGKIEVARDYFERALTIAREIGDRRGEGIVLGDLGSTFLSLSDTRQAISYYEQALSIAQEIGDRRDEEAALGNLGNAYLKLSDAKRAIYYSERALSIAREIDDQRGQDAALGNLGNAYLFLSDALQAIHYYEQALTIDREIGDRRGQGIDFGNLGNAYLNLGNAHQAIEYYEQALVIAREIGNRQGEGDALGILGNASVALGDMQRAINYYEQQLAVCREIGDQRGESAGLGNLGVAIMKMGDARRAIGYYQQQLVITQKIGDRIGEANALGNIGGVYSDLGDMEEAIKFHEQSLVIDREIGNRQGEGSDLGNLGKAYREIGDLQKGLAYSKEALSIFQDIGNRKSEGEELSLQGTTYAHLKDMNNAIKCWEAALRIASDIGDKLLEGNCNYNLALTFFNLGKHEQVLRFAERALTLYQEVGRPDWANDVRTLITKAKGNSSSTQISPVRAALEALVYADSPQSLESITKQFPFMLKDEFIKLVEIFIAEQVPPEDKPGFEKRVAFLRYLASQK